MKKREAELLALDRSRVLMEYIEQILSDSEGKGRGTIELFSDKVEGYQELMSIFVISVPERGFLKPINSGITSQQSEVFYEQVLKDLIENYLDSDTIELGNFYSMRGTRKNFDGLMVTGINGNTLKINFNGISNNETIDWYRKKIQEKEERKKQEEASRRR